MSDAASWVGRLLPVTRWLPEYGTEPLRGDLKAGLTVGVMLIPQGMAYAVLAGVPPIYGLYASLVPLLVYPLLGTSRHLAVGVNAPIMVIVAAGLAPLAAPGSAEYVGLAILVTALSGLLLLVMGAAQLGFLANLLSRPVIAGFTAAAALIIIFSQIGNFLGLELSRTQFIHVLVLEAWQGLGAASPVSVAIGAVCVVALLAFREWAPVFPGELTVLAVATAASWLFGLGSEGVLLVGEVPAGLPALALPGLELEEAGRLGTAVLALALVQFMSVVSLGRVFATRHGYSIDPNQELLAVGSANLVGSVFQGLPVSGSFSRTAVNEQAGARTALSNVFAAALIGVTLLFLTPLFRYLPMPALGAVIMVAAVGLIDVEEIRELVRAKPSDGWVAALTFFAVLGVGIQEGIILGVVAAVLKVLYRLSRPYAAELGHLPATRSFKNVDRFEEAEPLDRILMLRVEAGFSFFNAKFFRDYVLEKCREDPGLRAVILDGLSINYLDSTAVETVTEVVEQLREWGVELHFTGLTGPVRDVVEQSGLGELVGEDHFHIAPHYAVLDILERWDEEDDGDRRERYWRTTQQKLDEVEPTSESPYI